MASTATEQRSSGHGYGRLIKNLLETGVRAAPEQTITYADKQRFTYRELGQRVRRLASGLASLGVRAGDTVAVMDWNTHRYLECFFAVPIMGAVLRHVHSRLSPEQILYTINHAQDDVLLVNSDFLTLLQQFWGRGAPGKKVVLLNDAAQAIECDLPITAEYESLLAKSDSNYAFRDLDENTRATTFYTTGTTGLPKGVYYSHRQLVLHTMAMRSALADALHGRSARDDVYMPITPMLWKGCWLHTGDIAVMDSRGHVRITDRIKDVIKTGGEWVSSLQLEDLILHHPDVGEAAVIGVPDPKWTERLLAVVVAKQGHAASEADIKRLQGYTERGTISKYGMPDRIVLASALPKTSVGKRDKKVLREQYVT
jgi:acyl-CoA synthetase (AMP-forming)/AMP-acid ligase II